MTQLNDMLADIPLKDRIALFETHIKPFGATVHHKMHVGGKYEFKCNNYPGFDKYNPDLSLTYLRAHVPGKRITMDENKPLNRASSRRPEPNDGGEAEFGKTNPTQARIKSAPGWPKPKYFVPAGEAKKSKNLRKREDGDQIN